MFGDGISTSEVLTEVGTVYLIPDTLDPSKVFARVLVLEVGVDCRLLQFVGSSSRVLEGGREAGRAPTFRSVLGH